MTEEGVTDRFEIFVKAFREGIEDKYSQSNHEGTHLLFGMLQDHFERLPDDESTYTIVVFKNSRIFDSTQQAVASEICLACGRLFELHA
jgi:hypothetical protein